MKKLFNYSFILFIALAGCKKGKPDEGTIPIIPLDERPLLFGFTFSPNYADATWFANTRDTSMVSYKHKNLVVMGFLNQGYVTSPGGGGKNVTYFGHEVTDTASNRICLFIDKSTPIADLAKRTLSANYIESYQGKTTYNTDTYIIGLGGYKGSRFESYYYKIPSINGKPTYHPLPKTEYGNGYAWFCGTSKGLVVGKSELINNRKCILSISRDDVFIDDFTIEVPGYIYTAVEHLLMPGDHDMIAVVSAKKQGTPVTGLFYVTINLDSRAVKIYQPEIPEGNFHFGKSAYAKGKVYVPAYENALNKCSYFVLTPDNAGKIKAKKIDLPVKAVAYGSASILATNGTNVYVTGEQDGLACYWKNDKLVELNNEKTTKSAILDIMTFD